MYASAAAYVNVTVTGRVAYWMLGMDVYNNIILEFAASYDIAEQNNVWLSIKYDTPMLTEMLHTEVTDLLSYPAYAYAYDVIINSLVISATTTLLCSTTVCTLNVK